MPNNSLEQMLRRLRIPILSKMLCRTAQLTAVRCQTQKLVNSNLCKYKGRLMRDFFISYNRADKSWAEWIAWTLEDAGYSVIIQAWDFRPGGNFVLDMHRATEEAQKTIVVLSQDYLNAAYTQSEWAAAFLQDPLSLKRKLVPIRVKECKPDGILKAIVYVDLVRLSEQEAVETVLSAFQDRAKPPQKPRFPSANANSELIQPPFPGGVEEIPVFFSYAHEDESLRDELAKHLSLLRRQGMISEWHDQKILPGEQWENEVSRNLDEARIILLLISADFLASDYCFGKEMMRAMERHEEGSAIVIPIIVRPCAWQSSPFGKLQSLPRDGRPITRWSDRDEAFLNVAEAIRLACKELVAPPATELEEHQRVVQHATEVESLTIYSLVDVFKYPGVPDVTFVEPDKFYSLKLAIKQPGLGIVIEGPSGIGKTTALRKAIEQLQSDGQLGELEILSARKREDVQRIKCIEQWHQGTLAIDDFHRLEDSIRSHVADYLKDIADRENPGKLVVVGIPGTGKSLVEISFDLATRIRTFKLGKVKDEIILNMINKGESALNIFFDRKTEIMLASGGSLNIAQMLCSNLAAQSGIDETQSKPKIVNSSLETTISDVMEQLAPKFEDMVHCFASLDGHAEKTCIGLLEELAQAENGFLSLLQLKDRRFDLSAGIERFITKDYMGQLRERFPVYERYLYYNQKSLALVIDDPQLTFYLLRTSASRLANNVGKY